MTAGENNGLAPDSPLPTAQWRRVFRRRLLAWYRRAARELPWRGTDDPYKVWVSEIMLQQTQVATVGPYFDRFMARFPSIDALAAADEQSVLRLWEGLGYYRRARQLHRAAGIIVREHGGRFPCDRRAVDALPGIGRYTAGAILSIAFDQREPILEANTTRVFSRLLALRGDVAQSAGQRRLWALAETLLPRRDVGRFNQALMELGSQICTPREPRCDSCPVVTLCPTYSQGLQDVIPRPKPKPAVEDVQEAAVVVHRRRQVLLVRRGEGQRWAGLWDFPRFAVSAVLGPAALRRELAENVRLATGYVVEPRNHLATIKHGVTRFRITLQCHQSRYVRRDRSHPLPAEHRWLRIGQLEGYPLSVTGRKLARMLAERISDPLIRRGNYVHPVNGYNSSNAAEKAP